MPEADLWIIYYCILEMKADNVPAISLIPVYFKSVKKGKKKHLVRVEPRTLSIAPRQLIWYSTEINYLTHFCPWYSAGGRCFKPVGFIYEELKLQDIFEENKHGFDSQSRTLTHFVAFEEQMADKCLAKPSRSLLQLAILGVYKKGNWLRFSNSKHFLFFFNKETFHFRMIFH